MVRWHCKSGGASVVGLNNHSVTWTSPTMAEMPKGITIPPAQQTTIVWMSAVFKQVEICAFTCVSEWQQQQILKQWCNNGSVINPPTASLQLWGQPRNLSAEEVFVSIFLHTNLLQDCINWTCKVYVDELQEPLSATVSSWPSVHALWCMTLSVH